MNSITLYHYWRSSASWRVRWALELKGVQHEKVAVNLLEGEEKKADYIAKNPAGYLPALVTSQGVFAESMAIMEWLEEQYPNPTLLSADPALRCQIRRLAETINSGTQPLQNLDVMKRVSKEKDAQTEWVQHWINRGLGVYEKILRELGREGKKYSLTDYPTIADLCLIPQCYSAKRFEVDLGHYPNCYAIYDYAMSTKACSDSAPEKWKPAD